MSEELTDNQIRILRALKEHRDRGTNERFSMDNFYDSLTVDVKLSRFGDDLDILRDDDYVKQVSLAFNNKYHFGTYEIESKGLKYLRTIDA